MRARKAHTYVCMLLAAKKKDSSFFLRNLSFFVCWIARRVGTSRACRCSSSYLGFCLRGGGREKKGYQRCFDSHRGETALPLQFKGCPVPYRIRLFFSLPLIVCLHNRYSCDLAFCFFLSPFWSKTKSNAAWSLAGPIGQLSPPPPPPPPLN